MASQILALLGFIVAGVFYFVVRRDFDAKRVEAGAPKSLRGMFGALTIALIWIVDDLFVCVSRGCDPEFLSALKLDHLSFFVYLFYLHLFFALIELFYFLRPERRKVTDSSDSPQC